MGQVGAMSGVRATAKLATLFFCLSHPPALFSSGARGGERHICGVRLCGGTVCNRSKSAVVHVQRVGMGARVYKGAMCANTNEQ